MKNIFKYLIIISFGVFLFISCEEDAITISEKIVGFDGNLSGSIEESSSSVLAIPVYNAAASGAGCTVTFSLSIEGIDNPAIEGTDFNVINSSNTLTFANYHSTDTIYIQPIDNDFYDKDKVIIIELGNPSNGYELTNAATYTLTISDNEHPLALILGVYTEEDYDEADGALSAVYTNAITISANPDDITKVKITNFWNGGDYVIDADVDIANNTMTILPNQVIYVDDTHGDCKMVKMISDGVYDLSSGINCTIDTDGNIEVGMWAAIVDAGWFGQYEKSLLIKSEKN